MSDLIYPPCVLSEYDNSTNGDNSNSNNNDNNNIILTMTILIINIRTLIKAIYIFVIINNSHTIRNT